MKKAKAGSDLTRRLGQELVFSSVAHSLGRAWDVDRIGIAERRAGDESYVVNHVQSLDKGSSSGPRSEFPAQSSVGHWVSNVKRSFVGETRQSIRGFPVTFGYFVRERMESNFVVSLRNDGDTEALLFATSRRPYSFRRTEVAKYEDTVHGMAPLLDLCLSNEAVEAPPAVSTPDKTLPTLEEVQRAYIETVLEHTNGRIEGPGGAAEVLGMAPSTLRSRMRKVGVRAS